MNDTIVLDTNAIISLFDGNRDIANMLGEENAVIVPAIVCGEFEAGAQGKTRRDNAAMTAFNGLLSLSHVSVLPATRRTGRHSAQSHISPYGISTVTLKNRWSELVGYSHSPPFSSVSLP